MEDESKNEDGKGWGSVELALVAAQEAMKAVGKDGRNNHGRYDYSTAEGMIRATRLALNDNGLAFTRKTSSIKMMAGFTDPLLCSTFELVHGLSKGIMDYSQEYPISKTSSSGKGTWDKTTSAALTTSMSYMLRDLLLVVRSDDPEVDDREDNDQANNAYDAYDPSLPQHPKELWTPKNENPAPAEPKLAKNSSGWSGIFAKYSPHTSVLGVSIEQIGNMNFTEITSLSKRLENILAT